MSDAERARSRGLTPTASRTAGLPDSARKASSVRGRAEGVQSELDAQKAIFNEGASPLAITMDGRPLAEFNERNTLAAAQTPEGRATILRNDIARLEQQVAKEARIAELKAEIAADEAALAKRDDPRIDRTPQLTGIKRIDKAGQTVLFESGSGNLPTVPVKIDSMDDLPADHPDKIRKQRADDGIDMISGLDFEQRRAAAGAPNIPRLGKAKLAASLRELLSATPDDMEKMRWDNALQEHQVLLPTENGKFRWTSLDGTGVELGDLGDMFDLAEAGSMIGGIIGTTLGPGKVRFLKIKEAAPGKGGLAGAMMGRTIGDAIELVNHFRTTGEAPTYEELLQLTKDGAATEVLVSVLTEAGAKILRTGGAMVQEAAASSRGLQAVETDGPLDQVNKNIRDTKAVMEKLNQGGMEYAVTPGQATRSVTLLSDEAHKLKGANANTKRAYSEQAAKNDKALRGYIKREFDSDIDMLDPSNIIIAANDSITDAGSIAVAQTADGNVHFLPKLVSAEAENGVNGLVVRPGPKVWQVKTAQIPEGQRSLGFGTNMYKAAAEEAQARNAVLGSGDQLSPDSVRLWERFEKDGTLGDIVRHPDAYDPVKGSGRLYTPDGTPVFRMKDPEPITPQLLESFMKPGRGEGGRLVANKNFRDFLRAPGKLMNAVQEEISGNPYLTQQWKEAIFEDYEKQVLKDGKFNDAAWLKWKEDTAPVVDRIFTPDELIQIKTRTNGLRDMVEGSRTRVNAQRTALSRELNVDVNDKMFVDPSQRKLIAQMKSRSPKGRIRAMRIMDASGAGDGFRARFLQEVKEDLLNRTKGKNYQGFDKWLSTDGNGKLIEDVMGSTEYHNSLKTITNVLRRKTDGAMIRGAAAESNPTGLALFRVVFGPLSRTQRFLTGARRGITRSQAAQAADMITDPAMLREFIALRPMKVSSRQVARFALDSGLAESFGFGNLDVESEEDREAFANHVALILQEDLAAMEGNE